MQPTKRLTFVVELNRFAVILPERLIAMIYILSFPNVPLRDSGDRRLRPEEDACPGPPAGAGGPGHARKMDGRKRPATCRGRARSRGGAEPPGEEACVDLMPTLKSPMLGVRCRGASTRRKTDYRTAHGAANRAGRTSGFE